MNDDDVTLKRYQNLFRIATRAFYDEMAIVAVDYMVLNCKASMTEEQMEQSLRLPIKKLRAAFHKMKEDEIIREDPVLKRWTLTSNIKEILQLRLDAIKVKLAERISATNIKKYKCAKCGEVIEASLMVRYQGKCPRCKGDMIEMERDSNVYMKLKDLIKKLEESYIEACRGREFPAKMYPEEYHKLWESANKGPEAPLPIMISLQDKALHKKVIEKLNEQKKGKTVIKLDDNLLNESVSLQEYYKQNPTKLNGKVVTTADLLKKRRVLGRMSDKDYQEEYGKYLKKIKIL